MEACISCNCTTIISSPSCQGIEFGGPRIHNWSSYSLTTQGEELPTLRHEEHILVGVAFIYIFGMYNSKVGLWKCKNIGLRSIKCQSNYHVQSHRWTEILY
jgi:hypothetical protein